MTHELSVLSHLRVSSQLILKHKLSFCKTLCLLQVASPEFPFFEEVDLALSWLMSYKEPFTSFHMIEFEQKPMQFQKCAAQYWLSLTLQLYNHLASWWERTFPSPEIVPSCMPDTAHANPASLAHSRSELRLWAGRITNCCGNSSTSSVLSCKLRRFSHSKISICQG